MSVLPSADKQIESTEKKLDYLTKAVIELEAKNKRLTELLEGRLRKRKRAEDDLEQEDEDRNHCCHNCSRYVPSNKKRCLFCQAKHDKGNKDYASTDGEQESEPSGDDDVDDDFVVGDDVVEYEEDENDRVCEHCGNIYNVVTRDFCCDAIEQEHPFQEEEEEEKKKKKGLKPCLNCDRPVKTLLCDPFCTTNCRDLYRSLLQLIDE